MTERVIEIVGYSWNEQYAIDEHGNRWRFYGLIDHCGEDITSTEAYPTKQEDVAVVVLTNDDETEWCHIVLAEFKPALDKDLN